MADILIRGMEMPKTCCECDLKTYDPEKVWNDNGIERIGVLVCKRTGEVIWNTQRGENCPLYPMPEGHGRAIDADAIVAAIEKQVTERDKIMELCKRVGDMENYFRCSKYQTAIVSFARMLNNAPTIVPAEGGEADEKPV